MIPAAAEAIERRVPAAAFVPLPAELILVVSTFNERENMPLLDLQILYKTLAVFLDHRNAY